MFLKRFFILAVAVCIAAGVAFPGFAQEPSGPPLAPGIDGTYYEGIWRFNITERCHRHTDGGVVNLGTDRLYLKVFFLGAAEYIGDLYPTLEDARNETNLAGIWDFTFHVPQGGESYVIYGQSSATIDANKFVGDCLYFFEGWLKTVVKRSANQKLSKLTGSNLAFCEPLNPDNPYLVCSSVWNARWIEAL
ncbi:MAG: hypothetical protein JRH18_00160 [Deltaproteobacteria bacterium]|nr:hypothetical protein [Deltaproteobacteria bacterium]MBW1995415.1 hypothetical protein [Deltaproteobacteria bacterium]MBW2150060.1 hypothetical protein [Deltaproteobacteria bacterium]